MAVGRQFSREASIYLAGFVGAGILQFLAIPVYSRALGPEQYGYLALTLAATTMLSGVMILGGDVALARFWADARTEVDKRVLASTWIGFLGAWSVAVAAVACLAAPWLADRLRPGSNLAVLLTIGFIGLVPAQLSRMLAQILRNTFRPVPFALTTVLIAAGNAALGITFATRLDLGVFGIVLGTLVGEALGCLVRLPLVRGSFGGRLSWPVLQPMLRFGAPLIPASLAAWVFNGADRIAVGAHVSPAELGAYGLAVTAMGPFTVLTLALGQAWTPRIASMYVESGGRAREATALATQIATAGYTVAATTVGALAPALIHVVGGEGYEPAAKALPFLTLGAAFSGISLFASTGLVIMKRTALIPVVTVAAALVDLILLAVLVPRYGILGAGLTVACAYLFLSASMLTLSSRVFQFQIARGRLVAIAAAAMMQAALNTARPGEAWVAASWTFTTAVICVLTYASLRASRRRGASGAARPDATTPT